MHTKNRYTTLMSRAITMFVAVVSIFAPLTASAAILYVNPTQGTYGVSDTFIADVRLDNQNECVNAAHVEIRYPTDVLRAVDFSKGNSILSLWIEEPKIDTEKGIITFSGGIPGGYCGRIPGDPVLSNVLGKIVFSVIATDKRSATVSIADTSVMYLNDGQATPAKLALQSATYLISQTPLSAANPWLSQVGEDKTPPDAFVISVESTRGVFGGNFYAVFATQDKQSGVDHYEIFERGTWLPVTSPHELKDQKLIAEVQIKAIDKAGNERLGTYVTGSAPPRVPKEVNYPILVAVLIVLLALGLYMWHRDHTPRIIPPSA